MLSVTDLACSRGDRLLFQGVNLHLAAGGWQRITGANGAGKTTLLRTLVGLAEPEHGEVRWGGAPLRECADAFRRAALYLGHPAAVKDDLTPIENLRVASALDGCALAGPEALAALERMGLHGRTGLPTRVLSAGQKRRVLLARLLVRRAQLWVLDEPFAALDAEAVDRVVELLRAHLARGGMAVLTSHPSIPLAGGSVLAL